MAIGGDINMDSIRYAFSHYKGRQGIHFLNLDVARLPFKDASFELVCSMETVEHLSNGTKVDDYLRECKRVLKNGALFICSTPVRNKEVKPNHDRYSMDEFTSLVGRYFEVNDFRGIYYETAAKRKSKVQGKRRMNLTRNAANALIAFLFKGPHLIGLENMGMDLIGMVSSKYFPKPTSGTAVLPRKMIIVAQKPRVKTS